MSAGSLLVTVLYAGLLAWGFGVGVRQVWQASRRPQELLNPLFANRAALRLFVLHLVACPPTSSSSGLSPWPTRARSGTGRTDRPALVVAPPGHLPQPQPAVVRQVIGRWVVLRNFFEYALHVVVAALAVSWFRYYLLLWWIVAYRYLDVGPRRVLQSLYNTPEKRAARPWAPTLNWSVITTLYVLTFLAVYHRQILVADVPGDDVPTYVPQRWEIGVVVAVNVALALATWLMTKKYTESLLEEAADRSEVPKTGEAGSH